ncbi:MAG: VCBS repeat-containing protein, partial [Pseudomonadales bacterium]|nr:VCBS repeat-containing protein [Pseudomonadales bacterium]
AWATAEWEHVATLNVDSDHDRDLLLRNTVSGKWRVFYTANGQVQGSAPLNLYTSQDYQFQAALDVDGDGDQDILLRSVSTGQWRLFVMQSGSVLSVQPFPLWLSGDYVLAAAADLDGDYDDDVLLRNTVNGGYVRFEVESAAIVSSSPFFQLYNSLDYQLQVGADFDGDGDEDILLRNQLTGKYYLFTVENNLVTSAALYPIDRDFASEGDFNGDGLVEVLTRSNLGTWYRWIGGNSVHILYDMPNDTNWQIRR